MIPLFLEILEADYWLMQVGEKNGRICITRIERNEQWHKLFVTSIIFGRVFHLNDSRKKIYIVCTQNIESHWNTRKGERQRESEWECEWDRTRLKNLL